MKLGDNMGLNDTFASFQETMTSPLLPNEQIIKSGMVTIKQKVELITYNIFLTNFRIVFELNKNSQEFSNDTQDIGSMVGATSATDSVLTGIVGAEVGSTVGSTIHNKKVENKFGNLALYLKSITDIKEITFKAFGLIPTANKGIELVTSETSIKVWFGSHRPEWWSAIQDAVKSSRNTQNS